MFRLPAAWLAVSVSLLATSTAYGGKCALAHLPDIPVTMQDGRPVVHAQLNGTDAPFVADSGSFFTLVTPAAAHELHLSVDPTSALTMQWKGQDELAQVAWVKTFTIGGQTLKNVPFAVQQGEFGHNVAGLLGQNVFPTADVEYDLANRVIRLVQPRDCAGTPLAYWSNETHQPYSVIDIEPATAHEPHTRAVAYLNGTAIAVMFDAATAVSTLTLEAAKRAGMTPGSAGVAAAGRNGWIARFASFRIGDEEIKHVRLRFAQVDLPGVDMLIGADFFLSHRVYVASSQRKLYFTYNGGPVFDLTAQQAPGSALLCLLTGAPLESPAPVGSPRSRTGRMGAADFHSDQQL